MWAFWVVILCLISLRCAYCLDRLSCRGASSSQFAQKTDSASFMLDEAASGDETGMCRLSTTCCSATAEKALERYSRTELFSDIVATHTYMRRSFTHFETTFQELYDYLLDNSKTNALRIFNLVYKEHFKDQRIFDSLYAAAKGFYRSPGENQVQKALQDLFDQLLLETFKGSHSSPNAALSKQYKDCLLTAKKEMDIFGEEDDATVRQLRRALNSTSVFLIAVRTAGKVLDSFLGLKFSDSCIHEYMKMHPCSLCGGFPEGRPCLGLCMNVLSMCIGDISQLNTAFDNYLKATMDMLTEMENTSPDTLIGDLGSQLSFLVMEVYNQIKPGSAYGNKIIQLCGNIPNDKRRRSPEVLVVNQGAPIPAPKSPPFDMDLSIQLAFAKEIMSLFQSSLNDTTSDICLRESAQFGSGCWNGTDFDRYVGSDVTFQAQVDHHRQRALQRLIKPLQKVTGMMRKWNSVVDWVVAVPNNDATVDTGALDQPTAIDNETRCPEDDECDNGSGHIDGSGSGERPANGDDLPGDNDEDITTESMENRATHGPTETTVRGGAQSYQFVLTAVMTLVIVTSVYAF